MNEQTKISVTKLAIILHHLHNKREEILREVSHAFPNEKQSDIDTVVLDSIRMYESFVQSVEQAGGSGWEPDELLNMTFLDLISKLCTNNVRFYFDKQAAELKRTKMFL